MNKLNPKMLLLAQRGLHVEPNHSITDSTLINYVFFLVEQRQILQKGPNF